MKIKVFLYLLIILLYSCPAKAQQETFNWDDTYLKKGTSRILNLKIPLEGMTVENTEYENITTFDTIVSFLKNNPKIHIKIVVHSGTIGSQKFNLKKTQMHAKNILTVLIRRGISENRLLTEGAGENHPIISEQEVLKVSKNEQPILDNKNNRVEIILTKVG